MHPISRGALAVVFSAFGACSPSNDANTDANSAATADVDSGANGPKAALDREQSRAVTETLSRLLSGGGAAGFSAAIWRDSDIVYAAGFGTKNEQGEPVTSSTLFQIGSDTKKLTAISVLQGVSRGELELDGPVAMQLGGLDLALAPGVLDDITIHDLLTQQSGLFGYTPWVDAADDRELEAIARGPFQQHEFSLLPPRLAWTYCNANYSLLGLLVEKASGRPWADVVSQDVFVPFGMSHTYARRDDMLEHEKDIASGFGLTSAGDPFGAAPDVLPPPGWVSPEAQIDNAFVRPAGLVWSTASDQARLLGLLARGQSDVLSDAQRDQLLTAHVPMQHPDAERSYGYGVSVQSGWQSNGYIQALVVGHGGTTLNMTSMSLLLPSQHVAVVILANNPEAELTSAAFELLEIAAADRLPKPSAPQELEAPSKDLAAYTGNYLDALLGPATIALSDDSLTLSLPALTEAGLDVDPLLRPVALDLFIATIDGEAYPLSFHADPNGQPNRYAISGLEGVVLVRQ